MNYWPYLRLNIRFLQQYCLLLQTQLVAAQARWSYEFSTASWTQHLNRDFLQQHQGNRSNKFDKNLFPSSTVSVETVQGWKSALASGGYRTSLLWVSCSWRLGSSIWDGMLDSCSRNIPSLKLNSLLHRWSAKFSTTSLDSTPEPRLLATTSGQSVNKFDKNLWQKYCSVENCTGLKICFSLRRDYRTSCSGFPVPEGSAPAREAQ